MPKEFTFYDYVDDAEVNVINTWLTEKRGKVKAQFDNMISNSLSMLPVVEWNEKQAKNLHADGEGFIELRREILNVQYRLIGFFGTGRKEVTLIGWAIEKDDKFEPRSAIAQAKTARAIVEANPIKNRRIHGT